LTAKEIDTSNRLNNHLALLLPGTHVSLDITTPAGQRTKFRTLFIGYLPKKYALVQYPDTTKSGGLAKYIIQGMPITVRGLIEGHEGSVVAFATKVKQTIQIPSRMIVLDFPKKVTLQSLRSSLRIDVDIDIKIKVDNEYWKAIILNISAQGCQINVSNGETLTLVADKNINIIIEDFQGMTNINLEANICNIKPQTNGISMGVKFAEKSKSEVVKVVQHAVIATL